MDVYVYRAVPHAHRAVPLMGLCLVADLCLGASRCRLEQPLSKTTPPHEHEGEQKQVLACKLQS